MPRPRKSRLLPSITTYTEELVRTIASEINKTLATNTETLRTDLRDLRRDLGRFERLAEKLAQPRGQGGRPKSHKTCTLRGCNQPHVACGLCKNHYQQARYAEKKREMGRPVKRRSPGPTPVPERADGAPSAAVAPKSRRKAARKARRAKGARTGRSARDQVQAAVASGEARQAPPAVERA